MSKRKSPSDLRREARRIPSRLQRAAQERQGAWAEGGHPNAVEALTTELNAIYQQKRALDAMQEVRELDRAA